MIQIAIVGYGNLGRGVEAAVNAAPDLALSAILTRRPGEVRAASPDTPVLPLDAAAALASQFDVLILCGGSAKDLPQQTPQLARLCNVVDSFDTHADIPSFFDTVEQAAQETDHLALISCGWDPGLFSLMRLYGQAILPNGTDYTFWGPGVSQGHSDALRRVHGVLDARQYTIPVAAAAEQVRQGRRPVLTNRELHRRECYVVAEEGAELARIEQEIKAMPQYFEGFDTEVRFVSTKTLEEEHWKLPHGGFVLRGGQTGGGENHTLEFRLNLESNPAFTGAVLAACARAAHRLRLRGETGCRTMLDVPPALLSPSTPEELRRKLL